MNNESNCFSFGYTSNNNNNTFYNNNHNHNKKMNKINKINNKKNINNNNNMKNLDAELAKELYDLTVDEREQIFEEIHGVNEIPNQEFTTNGPQFITQCIQQLDDALLKLSRTKRSAWDRAVFLRPSLLHHVNNNKDNNKNDKNENNSTSTTTTCTTCSSCKFKLMFLRADRYDAKKAAHRIGKYFDDKLLLFGEDKLVKKITIDDLNPQDQQLLRSGPFILLPNRDRAGRPIWLNNIAKFDFQNTLGMIRCAWYQMMASLEDDVAQLKGVVNVTLCPPIAAATGGATGGADNSKDFFNLNNLVTSLTTIVGSMAKGGSILVNLPHTLNSFHFCYSNNNNNNTSAAASGGGEETSPPFLLPLFQQYFGKQLRLRCRVHYGSDIEIQYSLMTFGITCPHLFLNHDDTKYKIHEEYFNQRLHHDRQLQQQQNNKQENGGQDNVNNNHQKSTEIVLLYPHPNDILVGRGCPYQNFSGNIWLTQLVNHPYYKNWYIQVSNSNNNNNSNDSSNYNEPNSSSSRFEKTCIYMDVVKTVQDNGRRFLERTPNGWKPVDDKIARNKVSSCFRNQSIKQQQQQQQQQQKQQQGKSSGSSSSGSSSNTTTFPFSASTAAIITSSTTLSGTTTFEVGPPLPLPTTTTSKKMPYIALSESSSSENEIITHHQHPQQQQSSTIFAAAAAVAVDGDNGGSASKRLKFDPSAAAVLVQSPSLPTPSLSSSTSSTWQHIKK